MKRVADSQLTKDSDDGDDGPEETSVGFKKASETELASRKVKMLPKRASLGGSALPQHSEQSSPTKPKFSGFPGLGSPAANSSAFTFTSPFATPTDPQTKQTTPSFPSNFSPAPPPPTFAPGASTAQKFTSFVNSSIDGVPKHPLPTSVTQTREEEDYNAAFTFYKGIRGLNHSLMTFLTNAVKDDPFVDLSQAFDQYSAKRRAIQSVWDKQLAGSLSNSPKNTLPLGPDPGPSILFSAPSLSSPPVPPTSPAPKLSTPTLPSGPKPLETSSTPSVGSKPSGFMPSVSIDGSKQSTSFSFSSISASESSGGPPAPTFGFNDATSSDNKPSTIPNFFASSISEKSTGEPPGVNSKRSVFGGGLGSNPTSSGPFFGAPTSTSTGSLFGAPSTTLGFGRKDEEGKDKTTTPSFFGSSNTTNKPVAINLFGGEFAEKLPGAGEFRGFGAPTSSPTASLFGNTNFDKDKPAPPQFGGFPPASTKFAFGASTSLTNPGTSGGSIGNPVGYTFGGPSKTLPVNASSESTEKKPFTFTPTSPSSPFSSTPTPASSDPGDGDTEAADHTKVLEAGSVHDQEGEGEEDEETIHNVKTKVYTLNKEEGTWKDLGLGVLKVKKHKETGVRRLLLRNSSTGKVTINFRLYAGMKPSATKQVVSLIGHNDKGDGIPFRLRVKTEQAAQELKDVLDKEVPS